MDSGTEVSNSSGNDVDDDDNDDAVNDEEGSGVDTLLFDCCGCGGGCGMGDNNGCVLRYFGLFGVPNMFSLLLLLLL